MWFEIALLVSQLLTVICFSQLQSSSKDCHGPASCHSLLFGGWIGRIRPHTDGILTWAPMSSSGPNKGSIEKQRCHGQVARSSRKRDTTEANASLPAALPKQQKIEEGESFFKALGNRSTCLIAQQWSVFIPGVQSLQGQDWQTDKETEKTYTCRKVNLTAMCST